MLLKDSILEHILYIFFLIQKNKPEDIGLPAIEEYHPEVPDSDAVVAANTESEEGSWKMTFSVIKDPMVMSFEELLEKGREESEKRPGLFEKRMDQVKPEDLSVLLASEGLLD